MTRMVFPEISLANSFPTSSAVELMSNGMMRCDFAREGEEGEERRPKMQSQSDLQATDVLVQTALCHCSSSRSTLAVRLSPLQLESFR